MKGIVVRAIAFVAVLLLGSAVAAAAPGVAGVPKRSAAGTVVAQTDSAAPATSGSGDDTGGSDSGGSDTSGSDTGGSDSGSGATGTGQGGAQALPPPDTSSGSSQPPAPLNPAFDSQAKQVLQQVTAKQLDSRLPAVPLTDWFNQQIGKRAEIDWTTGDCSDESDSSSGSSSDSGGASYDPALCTEGQALFYGPDGKASLDRYVVLQVTVGSRQAGVNQNAASYGPDAVTLFVFDGSTTRTLSRLGDLTAALQSM